MQLAILIAVLAALAHSEVAHEEPLEGAFWRVGLTVAGALLAPLLAALGSASVARALAAGNVQRSLYPWFQQFQRLAMGVWLAACGVVLYVLEWPSLVRVNWSLGSWPLVDDLCILAPVVLPLILLWLAFYQVERAGQIAFARYSGTPIPRSSALSYIALQVRQHLALILLPALAVIAVQDFAARFAPDLPELEKAWWLGLPLIAGMLVLLPLVLRGVWRTSPLPAGELRSQLQEICNELRCPLRDILVWHTGGGVSNAAVAGITPWLRYVFLTDGLLKRLNFDELATVLRHELGHVQRQHLPLRMMLLTLPLLVFLSLQACYPEMLKAGSDLLVAWGLSHALQTSLGLPLLVVAYAVLVVGRYSRLLEHDADLAVLLRSNRQLDLPAAGHFSAALSKLAGPGRESLVAEWLHPSVRSRLAFLARAASEPHLARRFRRRLDCFAWLLLGLYVLAAAVILGAS